MWTTSIPFLRLSGGGAGDGATMACGMARGQVQIYDVRSSSSVRRPASGILEGMLCHCVSVLYQLGPGGDSCRGTVLAAGDAVGDVHLLDLLKLSTGRCATSEKSRLGGGGIGGAARGAWRLGPAAGGPPLDAQCPGVRWAGSQAVDVGCSGSSSSANDDEADDDDDNAVTIASKRRRI
jgi:hypothetical protein